jgi:hypothetical protein
VASARVGVSALAALALTVGPVACGGDETVGGRTTARPSQALAYGISSFAGSTDPLEAGSTSRWFRA